MAVISPLLSDLGLGLPADVPFTTAQATMAGVRRDQLTRLTAAGVLRRLLQGVYVGSDVPESVALRCTALGLVVPPDAFICDRTAAWIYTGQHALGPNEHLTVPPVQCFRPSRRHPVRGHFVLSGERAVVDSDLRELNGLVVTSELRTALDLGRLEKGVDMRLWGMDNLLATGAFTHDELLAQVPRFKGERGVVLLRRLAPRADPRSQSFGESALRNRWYDAGLPRPDLQIPIEEDGVEVAYLDMGLPELLFGAEYDGEEWHSDEEDVAHDHSRRAWLRTSRHWVLEVFRRQHVFGRQQNADIRLRAAAIHARRTLGERTFVI